MVPDEVPLRLGELLLRHPSISQLLDLLEDPMDRLLDLLRARPDVDRERARLQAQHRGRVHAVGERLAVSKLEKQTPSLAREHRLQDLERVPVRVLDGRRAETNHDVRLLLVQIATHEHR